MTQTWISHLPWIEKNIHRDTKFYIKMKMLHSQLTRQDITLDILLYKIECVELLQAYLRIIISHALSAFLGFFCKNVFCIFKMYCKHRLAFKNLLSKGYCSHRSSQFSSRDYYWCFSAQIFQTAQQPSQCSLVLIFFLYHRCSTPRNFFSHSQMIMLVVNYHQFFPKLMFLWLLSKASSFVLLSKNNSQFIF